MDTTYDYHFSDNSSSPANSWPLDQFVQDPGYLAYQEELRCLIFNTAQTAAPTREPSPVPDETPAAATANEVHQQHQQQQRRQEEDDHEAQALTRAALATGRRLEYLKNYVAEVAPWVGEHARISKQAPKLTRS